MNNSKDFPDLQQTRSKTDLVCPCGKMGGAPQNAQSSGKKTPGQLGEEQELLATLMESKKSLQKKSLQKSFSGEGLPGAAGVGGAAIKRGSGAVGTPAQVGKIGEGKGSNQDVTREGAAIGRR